MLTENESKSFRSNRNCNEFQSRVVLFFGKLCCREYDGADDFAWFLEDNWLE